MRRMGLEYLPTNILHYMGENGHMNKGKWFGKYSPHGASGKIVDGNYKNKKLLLL